MHARTDEVGQTASTLSETAMLLASIHDPDVLLETMARRIADAIGCDVGAVFLVDDNTGLFRFAAGAGPAETLATVRVTEGDPARFARLLAACEDDVVELSDIRADSRLASRLGAAAASALVVPLRRGDALVGVLGLAYTSRTGRFARRQVALAKGLAHHAAVALETARLVRSLEEANRVKSDFVAPSRTTCGRRSTSSSAMPTCCSTAPPARWSRSSRSSSTRSASARSSSATSSTASWRWPASMRSVATRWRRRSGWTSSAWPCCASSTIGGAPASGSAIARVP
jgi:hypothetical protein